MKKQSQSESDILGLFTKIQEQLTALDRKMDAFINKIPPQPVAIRPSPQPSFSKPMPSPAPKDVRQNVPHKGRPMHRAICADCQKECEIPFKPIGDRPVYCQECFRQRKMNHNFKSTAESRPQETAPVEEVIHAAMSLSEPPVQAKKRPTAAKRPGGKKKASPKRKR